MTEWISVKDRLPEYEKLVLVCGSRQPAVAMRAKNYHGPDYFFPSNPNYYSEDLQGVTHWMELPEPPKEKNPVEYLIKALEFRILYGIWPPNTPCHELNFQEYIKSILTRLKDD